MPTEMLDTATRAVINNEQLDGTISRTQGPASFEPTRRRLERMRYQPYNTTLATQQEQEQEEWWDRSRMCWSRTREEFYLKTALESEEPEEDQEEDCQDEWEVDWQRRTVTRIHREARSHNYKPHEQACPAKLKLLTSHRKTVKFFEDGSRVKHTGDWRADSRKVKSEEGVQRQWTGFTEFKLKKKATIEDMKVWMVKKGSNELKEEDISQEEWPEWKKADEEEWKKVLATGAVRVLSEEESEEITRQLKETGKSSRILPSRIVRRWKPSEQPGTAPSRKSRWCIRGDKDPDLLELSRYAPTVTTAVISIAMQIAANKGLPGMTRWQILEVLAGAYGLGDAPAHWRKSLKKVLIDLGYQQSEMDPCTFKYFATGSSGAEELCGIVVVEVDDLLCFGNEQHDGKLKELQQRFHFGKFVQLAEEAEGASFNGRRIKCLPGGGYEIDMTKFVTERLQEVELEKGRCKDKEAAATDKEIADTRAAVGALTWAAKEGRPDCAAGASLLAGSLNRLKIQDIVDLNKIIKETKANSGMSLKIQPIPEEEMCFGVITDAAFANAGNGSSQGGFGILCYEKKLAATGRARGNLLYWRSGKIHRVVSSTLAAETQSLAKGLQELSWSITVYNEISDPKFDLKTWERNAKQRRLEAITKEDIHPSLKQGLCLVDAKSLYDHLAKSTVGTTDDRRTAIEMQVIRQSLAETSTEIRWVRHEQMLVDCLTKRFGNRLPLYKFLESGELNFQDCSQHKVVGICEHVEHSLSLDCSS